MVITIATWLIGWLIGWFSPQPPAPPPPPPPDSPLISLPFPLPCQVDPDYKSAPPGWMYGECRGKSGLFPGNYVEKVSAAEATRAPPEPAKTTPDTTDVSGSLTVSSLAAALSIQFGTGGGSSSAPSTQSAEIVSLVLQFVLEYWKW